ncbi:hypothetical protein K402DRAFT_446809 [Aulographum hederae CBS 113979]|uniref:Uncharacterized protein n=1 Tax=Aulographum hederae CBS 113979 TaxID=1176131 RepID=A0A6G1GYU4_9PEZI|nr:hypothetical protein K402DRAFT_446809 [Aulographum hederae CBS 113979]
MCCPTRPISQQGRRGSVASGSAIRRHFCIEALRRGGSAADAAAAAQFCLGVTRGFTLIRSPNGSHEYLGSCKTAPAASSQNMYQGKYSGSMFSGLARYATSFSPRSIPRTDIRSCISGKLRGLQHLHQKHGRLPWEELVRPSVKLATPGYTMDFAPNGTRLGEGDVITRKGYADLREIIPTEGPDSFYPGAVGNASFRNSYRGYRVLSCCAPAGRESYEGFRDSSMLNISTHHFGEAIRLAYGARTLLGDPSFIADVSSYQTHLISDSFRSEIRAKMPDQHTVPVPAYNLDGFESLETPGTSHLSTSDFHGMAVWLTSTVSLDIGSHTMVSEASFLWLISSLPASDSWPRSPQ